jgi:uncharacterized membrane protein YfcA
MTLPDFGVDAHALALFGLVFLAALVASTLSGVTGFGGGVLMLPVLAGAYGVRTAVVILTITQAVGNASRLWFGRDAVDWNVAWRFIAAAVPAALLGSIAFANISLPWLARILGAFLLVTVVLRRTRWAGSISISLAGFVPLGAVFGFLSAVLGSVGPFVAPWFLAYGLVKTAYVSTEAAGALAMHVTKIFAYGKLALVTSEGALYGLALSPAMIGGSYVGARLTMRVPERGFELLIELVLVVAGVLFLVHGSV